MTTYDKTDADGNKGETRETRPHSHAFPGTLSECQGSLSVREYAAIKIMAGFAADPESGRSGVGQTFEEHITMLAGDAVLWADAVIKALNAPQ